MIPLPLDLFANSMISVHQIMYFHLLWQYLHTQYDTASARAADQGGIGLCLCITQYSNTGDIGMAAVIQY